MVKTKIVEATALFRKGEDDFIHACVDTSCTDPHYRSGVITQALRWEAFLAVKNDEEARDPSILLDELSSSRAIACGQLLPDGAEEHRASKSASERDNRELGKAPAWLYGSRKAPRLYSLR